MKLTTPRKGRKQRKGGNIFQLPLQVVQVPEVITQVRVKHQQAGIFWVSHDAVMAFSPAVVGFSRMNFSNDELIPSWKLEILLPGGARS